MPYVPPALHLQLRSSPSPLPRPAISRSCTARSDPVAVLSAQKAFPTLRLLELLQVPEGSAQDSADLVCAATPPVQCPGRTCHSIAHGEHTDLGSVDTGAGLRHPLSSPCPVVGEAPRMFLRGEQLYKRLSSLSRWCSRKVRDLWWQGIPPSVRGKVWSLAIGNELNITHGECLRL